MSIWKAIESLIKNDDTKSVDLEARINGIFTIRIYEIQEDPDEPSGMAIHNWIGRDDGDSWLFVEYGKELTIVIVPFEEEEAPCQSGRS